jgi:phosphate transport system protein
MNDVMRKVHTDSVYEGELRQVRENLLRMAGLVEQMIDDSVKSLIDRDEELASRTIEEDHKVNRFEVDTDEVCLLILAKRQPVASDLRFITLAMKMVTDLERIGDLAVNIGERTLAMAQLPPFEVPALIPQMSQIAQSMVRDAIDAFVERDAEKAEDVWDRDSEVDTLYHTASRNMQTRMHQSQSPGSLESAMHVHAVAKFLERIGDHATNLAELVVFMIKGKDVRHLGSLDV